MLLWYSWLLLVLLVAALVLLVAGLVLLVALCKSKQTAACPLYVWLLVLFGWLQHLYFGSSFHDQK